MLSEISDYGKTKTPGLHMAKQVGRGGEKSKEDSVEVMRPQKKKATDTTSGGKILDLLGTLLRLLFRA